MNNLLRYRDNAELLKDQYTIKSVHSGRKRTYKNNHTYSGHNRGGWLNVFFEDSKGNRAFASTFIMNGKRYVHSFHEI